MALQSDRTPALSEAASATLHRTPPLRSPGWLVGILAGLAAGALWGTVFVAPRVVDGFGAVDFAVGRFLACGVFSALLLSAPAWRGGALRLPTLAQAGAALGLSVLGYTGYYLLLVLAIERAGSVLPTLIIGTIPIWVMLLGKPVGLRWAALAPGLVLTLLGLGVMMQVPGTDGASIGTDEPAYLWSGVLCAVAAMACWTAFALLNAAWLKRHAEVSVSDWASWLGVAAGLGALGLWALLGSPVAQMAARPGVGSFAVICVLTGIGAAWVASVAWNVASRNLSPSLAGQLIVSETVFGVAYSFAWDGQWPAPAQWLACGLFVAGILASIRAHR